jgi:hypothetical protein
METFVLYRQAKTDLDRLMFEEASLKNDMREMERNMALLKHEVKEVEFYLFVFFFLTTVFLCFFFWWHYSLYKSNNGTSLLPSCHLTESASPPPIEHQLMFWLVLAKHFIAFIAVSK